MDVIKVEVAGMELQHDDPSGLGQDLPDSRRHLKNFSLDFTCLSHITYRFWRVRKVCLTLETNDSSHTRTQNVDPPSAAGIRRGGSRCKSPAQFLR